MKRLEGRVATITGGGSGIGKATAIRFASEGAHVVIADMDEKNGQSVASEVNGTFIKCNVTDKQSVDNLFAEVFKKFGKIDIA
ncbi:MAG: SDR family NAD(P)-dependent oxidoreductase, partial [Candidatus Nanopelagicales bacterium]